MITVKEISLDNKKDKKTFFKFLINLYKGNKYAAPNLYEDEFGEFDPKINDAFRFCKCRMFIAYSNGKVVGRIAGILHEAVNEKNNVKQLRFTRFDVIDDFEVTKALFRQLVMWAEETGMDEIIGPMSFSDLNEEGMLIDGFDQDSTYIEIYNYPYYVTHMEQLNAYKVVDWNCYRITVPESVDERIKRLADKIAERNGYTMLDIAYLLKHDKKKMDEYMMEGMTVLDEAFADLYGTSPLSDVQKRREMNMIYQALIPELAAVVLDREGKVACYGFLMPSMLKVLQKARGNVIPFGLIEYIKTMTHPVVADMMSVGVKKEHTNLGPVTLVMVSILEGCIKHKIKYLETGPELEENHNVQNLWKNFDRQLVKRHRCWGMKVSELKTLLEY